MNFELCINMFGQGLVNIADLINYFSKLNLVDKRDHLAILRFLIIQSKATDDDIANAIKESNLRSTYTPCVMLKKGIKDQNLIVISNLPEYELEKVLILFLAVFSIAYRRRFEQEKNHPHKWWYQDLSNEMIDL